MTKIIQRHDTAANWTSVNPVLAAGEMGVETDTNKFKFGDGVTAWSSLAYAAGEGGSGTTLTSTDGATTYSKLAFGDTLSVTDTSTKELNKLTQTGGTLNSELEFTGASGASLEMTEKYSLSTANSWEFQIKYKYNGGGSSPTIFGYASGSDYKTPAFVYESGSFKLYMSSNGSSWNLNGDTSGLVPVAGTTYFFKIGFTGSQYYIKYNTTGWDADFTTQWTKNSNTKVYCSDYFMLMNLSLNVSKYYSAGTMYLQDTALIINGEEVWRGAKVIQGDMILNTSSDAYTKAETDELLTGKQDKLTAKAPLKIRNETIKELNNLKNYGDGVLTQDMVYTPAVNSYLVANEIFPISTANSWYYGFSYVWHSSAQDQTFISCLKKTSNAEAPMLIIENGLFKFLVSYNNTQWDIQKFCSDFAPSDGQKYYFQFGFTGNKYYLEYSLEMYGEYTRIGEYNSSTKCSQVAPTMIGNNSNGNRQTAGSFPLDEFRLYINNMIYWQATKVSEGVLAISSNIATTSSIGVVQPDGTSITISDTGVISGQDVKMFSGYSDTGTLVLKSINGVLQWVAE